MDACSLQSKLRFQTLKEMSGVSNPLIDSFINGFYDLKQRFPELDEIPNANSKPYLIEKLHLKGKNLKSTSINNILETIGADDIPSATIKINNEYRDLQTLIFPIHDDAIVEIKRRPSKYWADETLTPNVQPAESSREKSKGVIINMLQRLSSLYGININYTNNDELNTKFLGIVSDAHTAVAFVYNGEIYINTDIASVDAPIHEMLHIFLGGIRFLNPELYGTIVNSILEIPNYLYFAKKYKDRTLLDLNEEIFVDLFAKYLTNLKSFIPSLPTNIIDNIFYNMTRIIDSSIMGKYSALSLDPKTLYQMSIDDLAKMLESEITTPLYLGTLNDAGTNRKLANMKEEMIKNKELILKCD